MLISWLRFSFLAYLFKKAAHLLKLEQELGLIAKSLKKKHTGCLSVYSDIFKCVGMCEWWTCDSAAWQ